MHDRLHIHQETLLLTLGDSDGSFTNGMIDYILAGAIISDLCLAERIEVETDKSKSVRLVDDSKTQNEVLDEVVSQIKSAPRILGIQTWIQKISQTKQLRHRVAEGLCQLGILKASTTKFLFLFTQKRYPELEGSWEDAVRKRMADVMFHPEVKADLRTGILIAFAFHCNLLSHNFAPVELKQHKERIKQLANDPSKDLASAEATKATIQAINAAIMAAVIIPAITASTIHS